MNYLTFQLSVLLTIMWLQSYSFPSVHSATPPLQVIRKFAHLLELSITDITGEAELLRIRQEVVRTIRFNKQLEKDLDLMDLKIGLLVRNRTTIQVRTFILKRIRLGGKAANITENKQNQAL